MDAQFWINAWKEGRTNFHQGKYHEKLLEYFPSLNPQEGERVLVPLCGKAKDLIWLQTQKLRVHGVELYKHAVEDFFEENNLTPVIRTRDHDFDLHTHKDLVISCGDFFKLDAPENYDFVYDRAALVALPPEMREDYAKIIKKSLKSGGKYLLITYEYDQTKLSGPPFSVEKKEVYELYQNNFTISLLESLPVNKEGSRLSSLESLKQTVYVLEKK